MYLNFFEFFCLELRIWPYRRASDAQGSYQKFSRPRLRGWTVFMQ